MFFLSFIFIVMKKISAIFILVFTLSFSLAAQIKPDTLINNGFYKSYFSYKFKEPLYVSYILYKGGGDCSRDGFYFKNDTKIVFMARDNDYEKSGYDRGHLVNSEDYAYDCKKDEATFRYYNCLPQTPNLNRGVWKKWEFGIRVESQTDSLFIVCGGIFLSGKVIGDKVAVPDYCFKIVQSLRTKKILWVLLFTNKEKDSGMEFKTIEELEKFSQYQLKDLLAK